MAAITFTAANVRPLTGAIIRRYPAGEAITNGLAVYVNGSGQIISGDADVLASAQVRGIVVGIGAFGAATAAVGDMCDVVVHGPVEFGSTAANITPGGAVFVSPTAGAMDQTAPVTTGQFVFPLGYAESASTIFVQPATAKPTALP